MIRVRVNRPDDVRARPEHRGNESPRNQERGISAKSIRTKVGVIRIEPLIPKTDAVNVSHKSAEP